MRKTTELTRSPGREIPVKGPAHPTDWAETAPGTTRYPGRNHPELGWWLVHEFCPPGGACADPMIGAGGLWLDVPSTLPLCGCDVNAEAVRLARINAAPALLEVANAETWEPPGAVDFVMFSPPYPQSHTSGATAHQREIREKKNLHAMQEFKSSPPDLLKVYRQVLTYCRGKMCVIVRNSIRRGKETDWVQKQAELIEEAGWLDIQMWWRDLARPSGYQQWKVARDPNTPWIKEEWVIVATNERKVEKNVDTAAAPRL